jgi:hypothetical protein
MITKPMDASCDQCGLPATVHLADTTAGADRFLCREHKPELSMGERSPRLFIKRWRMAPGNSLSRALAKPKDSVEHKGLYWDLCEAGLLGGDGACRYYLSMITGVDQFTLWDDEFTSNVREFVVSKTCSAAAQFCQNLNSIQFLAGFLRRAFEGTEGRHKERRFTKAEKAVDLLLHHPELPDETIAERVPTTLKQLRRCTDYTGLRVISQRQGKL